MSEENKTPLIEGVGSVKVTVGDITETTEKPKQADLVSETKAEIVAPNGQVIEHKATRKSLRISLGVDLGPNQPDKTRWAFITADAAIELGGKKNDVEKVLVARLVKELKELFSEGVAGARQIAQELKQGT